MGFLGWERRRIIGLLRLHRLGESVEVVCVLIHSVRGEVGWGDERVDSGLVYKPTGDRVNQ